MPWAPPTARIFQTFGRGTPTLDTTSTHSSLHIVWMAISSVSAWSNMLMSVRQSTIRRARRTSCLLVRIQTSRTTLVGGHWQLRCNFRTNARTRIMHFVIPNCLIVSLAIGVSPLCAADDSTPVRSRTGRASARSNPAGPDSAMPDLLWEIRSSSIHDRLAISPNGSLVAFVAASENATRLTRRSNLRETRRLNLFLLFILLPTRER